jgi:hypothetical protein
MVFDSAEVSEALEYRQLLVCEQLITKGWLPELWETARCDSFRQKKAGRRTQLWIREMQQKTQGDLVTTLGGLLFFGEQCLRQKNTENRLQQLEMKPHRFSRCYPDWRLDGARSDDLAGAESLAKVGKQRGNSPTELLSAEVFDFGDAVMMVAREQPRSEILFHTRIE